MPRPSHPPVVYVEWRDSLTATEGWTGVDDCRAFANDAWSNPLAAAGFLVEDNERFVVLAVGWNPVASEVNGAMMIPRSVIVSLVHVRPAVARRALHP